MNIFIFDRLFNFAKAHEVNKILHRRTNERVKLRVEAHKAAA